MFIAFLPTTLKDAIGGGRRRFILFDPSLGYTNVNIKLFRCNKRTQVILNRKFEESSFVLRNIKKYKYDFQSFPSYEFLSLGLSTASRQFIFLQGFLQTLSMETYRFKSKLLLINNIVHRFRFVILIDSVYSSIFVLKLSIHV